jgi:hypothetical protein
VQRSATRVPLNRDAISQATGHTPSSPTSSVVSGVAGGLRIPATWDGIGGLSSGQPRRAITAASEAAAVTISRTGPAKPERDRSGIWLRNAAVGLCLLAGAAAAVSFAAQYRMVYAARGLPVVAALEAAIPDAAALVFACLGVALALHGRRAVRARVLNVAAVGTSVFMNAIAAAPGWRSVAIWVLPPVAYALASDTLIGVVRARALARHQLLGARLGDEEVTPLAAAGGLVLWLLRLVLAPASTLAGFRVWVLEECPIAPGRRARRPTASVASTATPRAVAASRRANDARAGTKTARFLALVAEQHGPLAAVPLDSVSRLSAELAPQTGLNTGSARAALRRAVLAARNGVGR